jgi:hypothetical protein
MNASYLGDSFDIVKRFLCEVLKSLGYEVFIDPMFTGEWKEEKSAFFKFLGVEPVCTKLSYRSCSALLVDPDTGVNQTGGLKHVSFDRLIFELEQHALVLAFDQSFSREANKREAIRRKLDAVSKRGCHGLYYDSHASFLFVSHDVTRLARLRKHLLELGIPAGRLVQPGT